MFSWVGDCWLAGCPRRSLRVLVGGLVFLECGVELLPSAAHTMATVTGTTVVFFKRLGGDAPFL